MFCDYSVPTADTSQNSQALQANYLDYNMVKVLLLQVDYFTHLTEQGWAVSCNVRYSLASNRCYIVHKDRLLVLKLNL